MQSNAALAGDAHGNIISTTMKITDVLRAEHAVFHSLFDYIESAAPRLKTLAEIRALAAAMGAITKGHSRTEDELLIAPLEHCIEQMGQAEAFHTEHEEIDRTLMLIQKVKSVSKARQLMLSAVTASRAHFNKEERILFPMAEKVLNIGSLKNLAGSWQRQREAV
jgi:hemerythrin-like domain-containing protein